MMTKNKEPLPTIKQCLKYMESCGYELTNQYHCVYYLRNENKPIEFKNFTFTLTELRHAYKFGW